ncbi:hypothetical protein STCU_04176 [Strigomonas culicis]|uniref:Uncharacterized protein n=1 Tax=Strigomonas culicis TaxID=28005 RepID=S9U1J8_9TRYP|nr:hypothetical protein STCU_08123 [Strigomonas culicis]EPY29668.1 hypothetical protein STCU_04353 [Strigomonas culicis]EPY30219.1 hypothetical protein STCU_04176 [Strigomonas culicis]|eukprot:EPY22798.1 hypothetical protein STCU_08123 [Strigomonas culicis]
MFPGLTADMTAVPYRVFLGTLPALGVEQRFLRQLQAVFPWYTSRKRVKEQANEYIEIDLASCDPELLLRYTHVYYVRRQLYEELMEKQLTLIETGKATRVPDPALQACLLDCNSRVAPRLEYERFLLAQAKRGCCVPGRRELAPDAPLDAHDLLCMMRVVEEDACGIADAEMQAKSFLPRDVVEGKARALAAMLVGGEAPRLDKKEAKLLQRMIPADYTKVGSIEKLRPLDVTALYRFTGERTCRVPAEAFFKRSLYGHVFRKYATDPAYLRSISMYWARQSGLDPVSPLSTMPHELALAVAQQQTLFPALRFRAQYLYTSPDVARQQWRVESVVPLLSLFPVFGAHAAEDLAASVIVEHEWRKLQLKDDENPTQENVVRHVRRVVDEVSALYDSNLDGVLRRVEEGVKAVCPPLSEVEITTMRDGLAQKTVEEGAEANA